MTLTRTLAADRLGEFSLVPGQAPMPVVFVPLSLLQRELTLSGRVNTILVQGAAHAGIPMLAGFDTELTREIPIGATLELDPETKTLRVLDEVTDVKPEEGHRPASSVVHVVRS